MLFVVCGIHSQDLSAAEPGSVNALFGKKTVEPLPPEQAFQVSARLIDPGKINVLFTLKPDYYLYKDKVSLEIKGSPGVRLLRADYLSRPGRFFGRFLNKSGDLARQDLRASRGV